VVGAVAVGLICSHFDLVIITMFEILSIFDIKLQAIKIAVITVLEEHRVFFIID
jgi:hypothetical protein